MSPLVHKESWGTWHRWMLTFVCGCMALWWDDNGLVVAAKPCIHHDTVWRQATTGQLVS